MKYIIGIDLAKKGDELSTICVMHEDENGFIVHDAYGQSSPEDFKNLVEEFKNKYYDHIVVEEEKIIARPAIGYIPSYKVEYLPKYFTSTSNIKQNGRD